MKLRIHIGPDSVHVRNIFLPRYELKAKVKGLLDSMRKQGTPFRNDLSNELFLFLIQPAVEWLRMDRLIVIPQGDLESLPFQALRDPSDGTFAGERFQISYAPSASILLKLRKQNNLAGASLLAAADPSLPGGPEEVTTIARLRRSRQKVLTNSLIRKADLLQWAGSYDIVHRAVHGEFDAQEPLLSRVKLAADAG
jgi:CHAT domain-containing protein